MHTGTQAQRHTHKKQKTAHIVCGDGLKRNQIIIQAVIERFSIKLMHHLYASTSSIAKTVMKRQL